LDLRVKSVGLGFGFQGDGCLMEIERETGLELYSLGFSVSCIRYGLKSRFWVEAKGLRNHGRGEGFKFRVWWEGSTTVVYTVVWRNSVV